MFHQIVHTTSLFESGFFYRPVSSWAAPPSTTPCPFWRMWRSWEPWTQGFGLSTGETHVGVSWGYPQIDYNQWEFAIENCHWWLIYLEKMVIFLVKMVIYLIQDN